MLGAGGEDQERLGERVHGFVPLHQQDGADLLRQRSPARFPGGHNVVAAAPEGGQDEVDVRALARPFAAFDGDETTSRHAHHLRW